MQTEKARAAAARVEAFLSEIETEIGWTTGAEWRFAKPEQQRYDFIRLLREAPAITALAYIDAQGREQISVSRLEPDVVGSGKDVSAEPRFARAVAQKVWFGPVEFRRGSEPYMTISVAHVGKNGGVTSADVNLKLIWDVISAIHVGDKGFAYVVDERGRLIADPDLSLVLRDTDLSRLPQVKAALAALGADGASPPLAEVAKEPDGGDVLTAFAIAPKARWAVFIQQPLGEALGRLTQSLLRTRRCSALGLALAICQRRGARPPDGGADPGLAGGRGEAGRRRSRAAAQYQDRRRDRSAGQGFQPDGGSASGKLREPGGKGRSAHEGPQRGATTADRDGRRAEGHQPLSLRS